MGKELPMARQEEGGRPLLLARTSSGEYIYTSSSRNERKEETGTSKRKAYSPPLSAAKAGKTRPENKIPDDASHKAKGHRRSDKTGKPVGKHEGRDSSPRRSAKELGIEWPEDRCWESPTHAHWFTAGSNNVWICKYCLRAKWLPTGPSVDRFSDEIERYGIDVAYWRRLDTMPTVVLLLRKLEDLRLIKKAIPGEDYMKVVAAIMADKEYPYEENAV